MGEGSTCYVPGKRLVTEMDRRETKRNVIDERVRLSPGILLMTCPHRVVYGN